MFTDNPLTQFQVQHQQQHHQQAAADFSPPAILEIASPRRRFFDRKVPPTVGEWSEARQLYYTDGVEVWAIARMLHLSRKTVREIVHPFF